MPWSPEPSSPVVEQYQAVLQQYGQVVEFDISGLDRLGLPVTSCSLAVDGHFRHHGNGYGSTMEAARIGGLGELAEGVLSAARVAELAESAMTGSRRDLLRAHGPDGVADPLTLCLPAGSDYSEDTPLRWVPLTRVRTGETVWVPLEFVASESDEVGDQPALITPITNGLGAGLDRTRPVCHAILEILQRHTNGLRFRALDALSPVISGELPASVAALVERFRAQGIEPVLKHAATELGVCSSYAMGVDDHPAYPIQVTACGEAAHPSAEVSLTKALLEYANSRARKAFMFGGGDRVRELPPAGYWDALPAAVGEPRAVAAMTAWRDLPEDELRAVTAPDQSRALGYAEVEVPGVPELSSSERLLDYLLDRLAEHDVLATVTERDGVAVAKALVTGLEVETLSYGRIGELGVAKALAADLDLVRIQSGPSEAHHDRVRLTEDAEERLGGPAWYSYAVADRIVGPRYPLYREPPRHSVQLTGKGAA